MDRPVTLTLRLPLIRRPLVAQGVTALVVAAAGVVLAACSTQSPAQTQAPYLPADGVPASIGAVEARDLLVIAESKGATGVLSGSVINTSSNPVALTFLTVAESQNGGDSGGTTIQLAPGQQQRITGVQFADLPASPGALTGIVLKTTAGLKNVDVPVLLPDGPYSTLTATAGPSTSIEATAGTGTAAATGATTGAAAGGTTSATTPATATTSSAGG